MQIMKFIKSLAYPSEMLPPIVEEESHFDPETEHSAAKLGMWLFSPLNCYCLADCLLLMLFSEQSIPLCLLKGQQTSMLF